MVIYKDKKSVQFKLGIIYARAFFRNFTNLLNIEALGRKVIGIYTTYNVP